MKKKFLVLLIFILTLQAGIAATYPRWKYMPLHVYIPADTKYSSMMVRAFNTWQQKSNGIVRFKYVKKQSEADIYVEFVDYVVDCGTESAVGCTHNVTRTGFFTQSFIEIGTKDRSTRVNSRGKIYKTESGRSNDHLYGVMLHEVGHALGLGHSDNKDSIMYPIDRNELQYLTKTDLKLLTDKYR